jgi:serine phosphatase RsbU (regulator of sigma subunit)
MKCFRFIFILIFLIPEAFSQSTSAIDSLQYLLKTSKDTAKVELLIQLYREYKFKDWDKALEYSKIALAEAEKINYIKGAGWARLAIGNCSSKKGKSKEALENFSEALKISRQLKDQELLVYSLSSIGSLYSETGEYNKSIEYHLQALEIETQRGSNEGIAGEYTNLGYVYQAMGKLPEALESYLKVIKYVEKDSYILSSVYTNLGTIYYYLKEEDKALEYFMESMRIKESRNELRGMAGIYSNIAALLTGKNNHDSAIIYYAKAEAVYKDMGEVKGLAIVYYNLGSLHSKINDFDAALDYYSKARKIREEMNDRKGLASLMTHIGIVHWKKKELSEALDYVKKGLLMAEEIGVRKEMLSAFETLSLIFKDLNDFENAFFYKDQYLKLKTEIFEEDNQKQLSKLRTEYETDRKEKEIAILTKSQEIQKLVLKNKETEILKQRFENERQEKFLELLQKDQELQKLELERNEEIMKLQNLEMEKNLSKIVMLDKDKALQEKEIAKQRQLQFSLAGGILMISLVLLLLFNRYRIKQKNNEKLSLFNSEILIQKQEIEHQKIELEEKNKDITDSIRYAKRIQSTILPPLSEIKKSLPEHFILYKPKDIVSGDFYWFKAIKEDEQEKIFISAVDCTGHGVPGALMSIMGYTAMNKAIEEAREPGVLLDKINQHLNKLISQNSQDVQVKDGMDLSLCSIIKSGTQEIKLNYAGANNPVLIIRSDKKIEEIKADKMPIGYQAGGEKRFTNHEININKGDSVYLFTDGYADQFGGDIENNGLGKKLKYSKFKELLLNIQHLSMEEQGTHLEGFIEKWRGSLEQVDDICVIGIRI